MVELISDLLLGLRFNFKKNWGREIFQKGDD